MAQREKMPTALGDWRHISYAQARSRPAAWANGCWAKA
jgi:hypothetical protein